MPVPKTGVRFPSLRMLPLAAGLLAGAAGLGAQGARLNGQVHDLDGRPIKGATVVAEQQTPAPKLFTVASDERGRFEIRGLQAGVWRFTVWAPGFVSQEQEEDIALRGRRPMEFRLVRMAPAPAGSPAAINARQLQADLQAAEALLEGGQYDQAIAGYQAVLARTPLLTAVELQIARAYRLKKDYERAVELYAGLLKREPANDRAAVALADTYREKGDLRAAERTLVAAGSGPAATAEVFCALGDLRLEQHQLDEAADSFQKAAGLLPGWTRPVYGLGLVASARGDTAAAIAQMEKVIAADPASADAAAARTLLERLKK
jgi:tetratricopeptide (TPR) repeat protein